MQDKLDELHHNEHIEQTEFLSLILGDQHYAINIMTVKEIRGYEQPTKIANAPPFIKGVLNLRGDIVPIVDLRIKFDLEDISYNEFTIVIMLNIEQRIVGIVVDEVSDVLKVADENINPAPDFGVAFDSKYLLGLTNIGDQMVSLINIEGLIQSDELQLFDPKDVSDSDND